MNTQNKNINKTSATKIKNIVATVTGVALRSIERTIIEK